MENTVQLTYDLNALVNTYNIDNVYEQYKRLEFIEKLNNYKKFSDVSIIEFGPATGQMTELLSKFAKRILAVDGSSEFIEIAKKRVEGATNVEFQEAYFQTFETEEKFDCLIYHHIMEHIEDPVSILKSASKFLKDDGIIAISVPNADALSRKLAVNMGLLGSVYDLTENDIHHGHVRVYDWKGLEEHVVEGGLKVLGKHGLSFKLFSDKQTISMFEHDIIGEAQIKGLWKLADQIPEYAGALMIVAGKP